MVNNSYMCKVANGKKKKKPFFGISLINADFFSFKLLLFYILLVTTVMLLLFYRQRIVGIVIYTRLTQFARVV